MVSPSKAQQQQQQQPQENRSRETDRRSHVRIQKGPKPLEKNTFYLDIKNHVLSNKLEAKIKDLGGRIEVFLGRSVTLVVSDGADKTGQTSGDKVKWGWPSGGSGGLPSLRSVEVQTPVPTPPTPSPAAESPLANSTNLRGIASRPKSRADAMLERALTQPQQYSVDPLKNAKNWGIPIWATSKLQIWLDKIYASLRGTYNLKQIQQPGVSKDPKVKHLKAPYIKFESCQRDTRPIFLELPSWPKLNFEGDPGACPFDIKRREEKEVKISSKDIKENKKGSIIKQLDKDKDMTRRPRGGATRTRRTEQLVAGYCEICRIDYRDLKKHVRSDQHLKFVRNDDNFLSLDSLINAGASVEAFLNFNRSKDISLFPNVSRSLRSVVLPEEKVEKSSKPDLDNYSTGNNDMVQCNGARRNLDLKLNPSHNLRTRAKHESGHLLRSKGSPWHEVEKSDKFYDKFEGFTIKKRAKGTIWIEEDDPDDKCVGEETFKVNQSQGFTEAGSIDKVSDASGKGKDCQNTNGRHNNQRSLNFKEIKCEVSTVYEVNCVTGSEVADGEPNCPNDNVDRRISSDGQIADSLEQEVRVNGHDSKIEESKNVKGNRNLSSQEPTDVIHRYSKSCKAQITTEKCEIDGDRLENGSSNGHLNEVQTEERDLQTQTTSLTEKVIKEENLKVVKPSRRGGRTSRGRNKLSIEERLIEDNRAYYKVEVLGNKLRSSTIPSSQSLISLKGAEDELKKDDAPSSEKPVVVRFKRVRKSELSLLSDEAESFMFGEPKRDETGDLSESDRPSTLPNDTESERELTSNSFAVNSSVVSSSSVCEDAIEEDSQDSVCLGRARKRRRTQAEALIKDNSDYYKFQTPGSRLRYQASVAGVKESEQSSCLEGSRGEAVDGKTENVETFFSSKPSPEVEKLQFSFEAVPKSEPWYQTYQRQDEGAEFWHCFSEGDTQKPFLLPYEIENFHETLMRSFNRGESNRKRGRGRGGGSMGRSPRKSPRCHASTLAIMSTIIRKREQFQSPNLSVIEEETQYVVRSQANTPRPEANYENKSEVDEDLKEMARNIDDMLCGKNFMGLEDSFEPELSTSIELNIVHPHIPKGPPPNLLELLDNCQDINCLDNSSCASSECGEIASVESPLKRRKRRKNRTGWPGIKIRKKLQAKHSVDGDCERENVPDHKPEDRLSETVSNRLLDPEPRIPDPNGLIQPEITDRDETSEDLIDRIQGGGKSTDTCTSRISNSNSRIENSSKSDRSSERSENRKESSSKSTRESSELDKSLHSNENSYKCGPGQTVGSKKLHTNSLSRKHRRRSTSTSEFQDCSAEDGASKKQQNSRRRQQNEDLLSSETHESDVEDENRLNSCRKETGTRIHQINNSLCKTTRRVYKEMSSESQHSSELREDNSENSITVLQKQSNSNSVSRKRQREDTASSDIQVSDFEDENSCKKDTNLNIGSKKQQSSRKRQRRETISSEARDSEIELTFSVSQRVSPVVSAVKLENRRSSIEFQPVVRMTKIDDQVDMDNGVLSVTVASNRRLRSSTSPRSNLQPPTKRSRNARGKFGRWIKNS